MDATFTVPTHGSSAIVTCLLISQGRTISADDKDTILVHSLNNGNPEQSHKLTHDDGVWALAVSKDNLVGASADRTIRIWGLVNRKV
jgi:F-box and WD-40 domain protein CDC4